MKRPILGLMAAAILNVGVLGTAPAWAAEPHSTAATATPAHHHHGDGHRHHSGNHDGDHDGDHHGYDGDHDGHHRRCAGLVVVCLL